MDRDSLRIFLSHYYEEPVSMLFSRLGFSPNGVTLIGLLITAISALLISFGYLFVGGLVMLGGSALDLIDGGLARRKGLVSRFGALLDSVVDRLQESLVLVGVLCYYVWVSSDELFGVIDQGAIGILLSYTAFVGSVMVSYLRARSESLGIECKVGIMTRPERVLLLGGGLLLGQWISEILLVVLLALTIFGLFTTVQRLMHSSKQLER